MNTFTRLFFVGFFCFFTFALNGILAPPVNPARKDKEEPVEVPEDTEKPLGLQYEKYLKEVVGLLETDPEFRKKLEDSNVTDVKSGKIAEHLHLLGDDIRTRLDELKREEVYRLNQIKKMIDIVTSQERMGEIRKMPSSMMRMVENARRELIKMGVNPYSVDDHLDMSNDKFHAEDLKKLIVKASDDLENLDAKRRDDFKRYEMEKERMRRDKLKQMPDNERQQEKERFEEMRRKHRNHPKLNHPGSRDQLAEVWEEKDGLDKNAFDPKTFFYMHDTNSDGILDESEVEALFIKELDKVYDPNAPEDDMTERYEEMNRMREHVYSEVDRNRDRVIDLKEFIESTKDDEFKKNEGWDTLEDQEIFSDEELEVFAREREEQLRQEMYNHDLPPGEIPLPRAVSEIPQRFESHQREPNVAVNQHHVADNQVQGRAHHQAQGQVDHQAQAAHHQAQGQVDHQAQGHHQAQQQPVEHQQQAVPQQDVPVHQVEEHGINQQENINQQVVDQQAGQEQAAVMEQQQQPVVQDV